LVFGTGRTISLQGKRMKINSSLNPITLSIGLVALLVLGGNASAQDDNASAQNGRIGFSDDNPDHQCTCTVTPGAILSGVKAPLTPTPGINYCSYSASFAVPDSATVQTTETWLPKRPANARIVYDPTTDTSFGELRLPQGDPPPGGWPVVVYIHGGAWTVDYTVDYTAPFLEKLTEEAQVATWSLEFRRIGNVNGGGTLAGDEASGGWPNTMLDVGKGADYLRNIAATYHLNLNRVIAMGHSSGGDLALWLAARHKLPSTSELYVANPLPLVGVVAQEGLTSLELALADDRTDPYTLLGVVIYSPSGTLSYSGDSTLLAERLAQGSPVDLLPFGVPERLIVGAQEPIPYKIQGEISFTQAARAAGDDARAVLEEGRTGAFDDVDTDEPGWPTEIGAVLQLLKPNEGLTGCAGASWRIDK
jgi:acetyl esterase/lipase